MNSYWRVFDTALAISLAPVPNVLDIVTMAMAGPFPAVVAAAMIPERSHPNAFMFQYRNEGGGCKSMGLTLRGVQNRWPYAFLFLTAPVSPLSQESRGPVRSPPLDRSIATESERRIFHFHTDRFQDLRKRFEL